jgi:hypothetical protein
MDGMLIVLVVAVASAKTAGVPASVLTKFPGAPMFSLLEEMW